ncbi:phosphate permease : Phosphate transporter OS=Planctomyces limnophilus (strain ATCC 43296 / DSM 3776 / IFAM 1008 / 290) GN=Plim_2816 PE=4 SV=1: PHO4 [Gemmataceae bacterium]|nr:phosphate permease : Phosphate transporter OS=Planctomyces limnophilus (strain ATCC 43296 / DSM 3776 / IFAM 1008 / 290) GN=Plim_2816 PE=4 SV=1: PHO4 [Gemmataceae bacterium]VTU02092.1 phosphate permease : Phosphate transporter OS=Planctomyces limnophilus (strain ATCC 43296 / DSM 3776 / IFAM 1008 / 290) GN=Plim_2816 PE=4 SV=1: PHO4 [Gemmataceae bacterium]
MLPTILFLAAGFVAFTNGANANFKGVASLYGSGTTTLRAAARWGTAATFAGSVAALFLAHGLVAAFSGRGVVPDALVADPAFLCAVALGAAGTSFLATRLGFPVSTTHALVGALAGAGLAGSGEVRFAALVALFVYPLFFSPLVAAAAGAALLLILNAAGLLPDRRTRALDVLHVSSAGVASFARGLNDTPKMAALVLAVPGMDVSLGFLAVAAAVALGGLLDIDRVAETLGKKVTDMNAGEGFAASVVTAGLVTTASLHALPVSTTHVSVGALLGIGAAGGRVHWRKVGEVLLAWVSTVPCGAALAAAAYAALALV